MLPGFDILYTGIGFSWSILLLLGQANYLPYPGTGVVLIWVVTYDFGEETG